MSIIKKHMELEGIAELRQLFISKGNTREYIKNEFFMQRGQKHNHLGFILKGGFRYLGYTSEGNEQIIGYSFENDFVASYSSFQTQQPSNIDAQAISNSTVLLLTYEDIKAFYDNCGFADLRSKVAETLLNDSNNRLLSLYCDSAEERYQNLIKNYPDILNLVSLKEIASLIKIRPETLSRIRRRLSFQKNY
nr:Crp/Fnr family transcriptional regulator [uncultured Bacteroides sp.]